MEKCRHGIQVAGISSDGDCRLLTSMRHHFKFNEKFGIHVTYDEIQHCKLRDVEISINVDELNTADID